MVNSSNQARLLELLEAVKVEYDQLNQDAQITKSQRDEYEHKGKVHNNRVKIAMNL